MASTNTASDRGVRRSLPTTITANGVEICVQTFGQAGDPAILLIAGAECSMDWWEDEFCELLAAGPRFVIRYDLRDTGQSVTYPPGAPEYDGSDLTADALGVLDALGIERAHIVGMSSGGGMGQELALVHADRVATLTLLSTSPVGPRPADRPDLPPMSAELASRFAEAAPEPDWSDREAVIDHIVEGLRPFSGSLPFDEDGKRALAGRIFDRTINIASSLKNHWLLEEGESMRKPVSEIIAPTLVLHGTEDPLFPYEHGEALAREIPEARLVPLEGAGHELPPAPALEPRRRGDPGAHVLAGKCECGAVRYRVADEFLYASNCHCSRCRAATGSAFKPFAGIEREKLEITDGADGLLIVGEETLNDTRCARCGSLLFSIVRDGAYVHVALGSLVDAPSMRPTKHIFVGSKAPWFEITDDLPQFEEHATS